MINLSEANINNHVFNRSLNANILIVYINMTYQLLKLRI